MPRIAGQQRRRLRASFNAALAASTWPSAASVIARVAYPEQQSCLTQHRFIACLLEITAEIEGKSQGLMVPCRHGEAAVDRTPAAAWRLHPIDPGPSAASRVGPGPRVVRVDSDGLSLDRSSFSYSPRAKCKAATASGCGVPDASRTRLLRRRGPRSSSPARNRRPPARSAQRPWAKASIGQALASRGSRRALP